MEVNMEKNKPIKKFKAGGVSATIWKNTNKVNGKDVEFQTIAIDRSYTDKDKKWRTTSSMRINDLPKVELVARKAYEYLTLKEDDN